MSDSHQPSVHTHYDNLKVARNAPPEVVRAAFRALAQRYHPDLNSSPDAARVMKLLNEAWHVLGDPERRAAHDAWIAEEEKSSRNYAQDSHRSHSTFRSGPTYEYTYSPRSGQWARTEARHASAPPQRRPRQPEPERPPENCDHETNDKYRGDTIPPNAIDDFKSWWARSRHRVLVPIGFFGVLAVLGTIPWPRPSGPPAAERIAPQTDPPPARVEPAIQLPPVSSIAPTSKFGSDPTRLGKEVNSATGFPNPPTRWSPNGKPWPSTASYVSGFPQRAAGGMSKLTIDNTNSGSDVHVKLCRFSFSACDGLRQVFIPAGSSFTIKGIAAGKYDVRYRDLTSGSLAMSDMIELEQFEVDGGTKFSVVRLTLYKVAQGNTTFVPVAESQF